MISNTPPAKDTDPQQEIRSKLRESFLQALSELNGEACNILTFEQSKLTATFTGWNVDGKEILVRNLKTPTGLRMAAALLKTPDVLAIEFDNEILLS